MSINSPAQSTAQPRTDLIGRRLGLAPQPLAANSDRLEQLAILLAEIEASEDAVALFQIAEMAFGKGKRIVGC